MPYLPQIIAVSIIGGLIVALSNRNNWLDFILSMVMVPVAIFIYLGAMAWFIS